MSNAKTSISRRFLAALLSFVLVLGLLPTSTLTAFAATAEHPDAITVSVTDQDDLLSALYTIFLVFVCSSTMCGSHFSQLEYFSTSESLIRKNTCTSLK